MYIQWNLSNPDTLGTEESVLISEVRVLILGVVINLVFGADKCVLVIEVSSFQGVLIKEVPLYMYIPHSEH